MKQYFRFALQIFLAVFLLLGMSVSPAAAASPAINTLSYDYSNHSQVSRTYWAAQSFQLSSGDDIINSITLNLAHDNTSGTYNVEIWTADGSPMHPGVVLARLAGDIADVGVDVNNTVVFSGLQIRLATGTDYFLVVHTNEPLATVLWGYGACDTTLPCTGLGSGYDTYWDESFDSGVNWTSPGEPTFPYRMTIEASNAPTAVSAVGLAVQAGGNAWTARWQTDSESDVIGFNLYRADAPGAARVKLNDALIEAKNPGGMEGNSYEYSVAAAPGGVFWLGVFDGVKETLLGGIGAQHSLYLPGVRR